MTQYTKIFSALMVSLVFVLAGCDMGTYQNRYDETVSAPMDENGKYMWTTEPAESE